MMRQYVHDHLAVFDSTAGWNLMAKNGLFAVVMHPVPKDELRSLTRPIERPTGQAARNLLYVLLSISAFYSQRVKLHYLSRVVLIDPRLAISKLVRDRLALPRPRVRLILVTHLIVLDVAVGRIIKPAAQSRIAKGAGSSGSSVELARPLRNPSVGRH